MKKITLLITLFCFSIGFSQTFTDNVVHDLQNGNATTDATCGTVDELNLPLAVTGVGTLGGTNSIESVTINITHSWNADVRLSLVAPDGTTTLELINDDVGGNGDGFTNCIFIDGGATLPTADTTPVTGSFAPHGAGAFASFNSASIAADGNWTLFACDNAGGDTGTIDSWSITFIPTPACVPATFTLANGGNNCPLEEFFINVNVTALGSAATVNILNNGGAAAINGVDGTASPYSVGPFPANTDVTITVEDAADSACNATNNLITLAICPPADDVCTGAIPITVGSLTCGPIATANNVGSTDSDLDVPAPPAATCTGYDGGDVWLSLVVPASGNVVISGAASDCCSFLWYEVYDGVDCSALTSIACSATDGADPSGFEMLLSGRTPGETLWIRAWDSFNDNGPGDFNFCAFDPPSAPDCAETPITPLDGDTGIVVGTPTMLTWTAPSSGPAPTSYNVYVGAMMDGSDQAILGNSLTTSFDVTWIVFSTTIYWSVRPLNGPTEATGCLLWSFTTEPAPPPPVNDDCGINAIALTPGAVFATNPIGGQTNVSATDSGELPLPGCASYDPADASGNGGDVWYSVVVPLDGNIILETAADPTGNGGDSGAAAYSGSCGALVLIACNDDGGDDGLYSKVIVSDVSLAGQTIYFRVWEFGGDAIINFQVSAHSATLSIGDSEFNNFSYFPNPVTNELTLRAQNNIQNVIVYNMLGQQVLTATPNAIESNIDMNSLSDGAYFVKVTINNATKTIRVIKN